jgi:tyrosine-protein phosphatase YwqE
MFSIFKKKKVQPLRPLFFHTDIHSHLCPGIDDGAATVEDAVGLLTEMSEIGLTKMIITPHITDEVFPNTRETIDAAFAQLKNAAETKGINMRLDVSAEHRIDDLLTTYLQEGRAYPLKGDYILVENPWIREPFGLDVFMSQLVSKYGFKPILAHPERYPFYIEHPESYNRLHEAGVRFQVNLLSLSGYYGKAIKKNAEMLLRNRMVSFIGTDLHHMMHVRSIRHYLRSKDYDFLLTYATDILNDPVFGD